MKKYWKGFMLRLWPVFFIIIAWFVFASPYVVKGRVPFPSTYLVTFFAPWSSIYGMPVKNNAMPDVITQIYPWKRVTIASWKLGQVPLWNPYSFSGTAHAGNYQSAVFSPVNLLFFVLPEIDAWSFMILLQPLLAGLFMLLFLKSFRLSKISSVLGSIAFMFCGFIVVWMAYGTLGYAVLYLPLALFAINKFVDDNPRWALPLLSVSVALSFVSGHLQMSLYVLAMTLCYLIFRLWHKPLRQWIKSLVFVSVGLMLTAPQMLLSFDAFRQSGRSIGVSRGEIIPWQYLTTLFAPDLYGNPVTRNDWFGHYAEWASFIGVVPLLLAFGAIWKKFKEPTVRFFTLSAVAALLLAVPSPLNSLIYTLKVPVLSNSAASRIIALFSFSLAALSGFGMEILLELFEKKKIRVVLPWLVSAATFTGLLWIWLIGFRPLAPQKLTVAIRNSIMPTGLLIAAVAAIISGFFLPKRIRVAIPFILLLIAAFDVSRFAAKWMPFDPREYVYPKLPVIEKTMQFTAQNHAHVLGNIGGEVSSAFGLQLLDGYDALYQQRYGKFVSAITKGTPNPLDRSVVAFDKHGKYSEDILQLLGTRYYVHKKSDGRFPWAYPFWEFPQYHLVWEDDNFQILENTKSLPRAFLASSYEIKHDDQEIFNALVSPTIDRRETLILESEPDIKPQQGAGEAHITRYTPNSVTIETNAQVPKLLFLSDVYDPGWQVTVDGQQASLLRADYDFRAVAVPAGEHVVRMQYWPKSITIGLWFFLFGTLVIVLTLVRDKTYGTNKT